MNSRLYKNTFWRLKLNFFWETVKFINKMPPMLIHLLSNIFTYLVHLYICAEKHFKQLQSVDFTSN